MIRNSSTKFLIFTGHAGEQSIEARYEDETIRPPQKLMAALFAVDMRSVVNTLKTSLPAANWMRIQLSANSG